MHNRTNTSRHTVLETQVKNLIKKTMTNFIFKNQSGSVELKKDNDKSHFTLECPTLYFKAILDPLRQKITKKNPKIHFNKTSSKNTGLKTKITITFTDENQLLLFYSMLSQEYITHLKFKSQQFSSKTTNAMIFTLQRKHDYIARQNKAAISREIKSSGLFSQSDKQKELCDLVAGYATEVLRFEQK